MFPTDSKQKCIRIEGGIPLNGEVEMQGAKNSALPAIAAALLVEKGETVIRNIPYIQDVFVAIEVARALGAKVNYDPSEKTVAINAENLTSNIIPPELSEKMRASLLFLPPLVARLKKAQLLGVGGCQIGQRKIDFHHRGFVRLGARVEGNQATNLIIYADFLKGTYLYLDMPSHTGTENLMMAACLAEGDTIIDNASSDPEIADFACLLNKMGAKITGVGSRTIYISGVKKLSSVDHTLIPDRHDASAFAMAIAATKGKATLKNVIPQHQRLTEAKLAQMGVKIEHLDGNATVTGPEKPAPINIMTTPYPGFPTDAQPGITALATLASGESYIRETIFDDRFGYIKHLNKMGAGIVVLPDKVIVVNGVNELHGTKVIADDLRAGFALIIAALAAKGTTIIENPYQIERGHERILERLSQLGAKVAEV